MITTVIHGQNHQGSTYHITKILLDELHTDSANINTFYLPKDGPDFCTGCANCFMKGEQYCPHADRVQPIADAIDTADLIIFDSPTYVLNMSGQMKTLLDHFGYRFMVHRPSPAMFNKTAVIISTTAGAGAKKTTKLIKDSLFFWGTGKIHCYGKTVKATSWNGIKGSIKDRIQNDMKKLTVKIQKSKSKIHPGIKTKGMFQLMRALNRKMSWNPTDAEYWKANGWLDGKRPW